MIEAGCQYLRFYKANGQVGVTLSLVNNGTFDASLTGWTTTTAGAGVVAWNSIYGGVASLSSSGGAGLARIRQDVTVVANTPTNVSFRIQNLFVSGTGTATVAIGSTSGGSDLVSANVVTGTNTYQVTSPTTTLSLTFTAAVDAAQFLLDDVTAVTAFNPLEVATPYDHAQLSGVDTVQSADEQYWLHACVPTRKLQSFGDTCWKLITIPFNPPPSIEYGERAATEVQAGALTGNNVTFTAFNGPTFLASDKDREIKIISGANAGARAGIKSVTSSLVAVANICVAFINTNVNCNGTWIITGSPLTTCKPGAKSPAGLSTTLTLGAAGWRGSTFTTDTHCGKFAHVNGGTYEITCITSTTVAKATIRGEASSITQAESGAWSLEESLWSCFRGYPQTGDFKDDRLYLDAGFRFAGSKTGDYENHGAGVLDDDAVLFAINSKSINSIRAIVGGRTLEVFTVAGQYVVRGTSDGPITPTDVSISHETNHTTSSVPPVRVNDVTLFLTRFGRQLREFTIPKDSVSDIFVAPDLLLLADHLTTGAKASIAAFAYQREPISTIWCVLTNGLLISCTYRREENVVAWASHDTCGTFESVAVMPHPDGDREQVWLIVNRTINGATKRYVEYLDDSTLVYDRRLTDASVTYNTCVPVTVFTGLDHLECATVQIQADGRFVGTCVVAQGRVGITTPASKVEIGLPYVSEGITLPPEVQIGGQSSQPMKAHWSRLFLRVKDSCGMFVRTGGGPLEPVHDEQGREMAGSGDYDIVQLGDWRDKRITFRQERPLPSTVLMIGGLLDLGDM
jgi:hypothetical protein